MRGNLLYKSARALVRLYAHLLFNLDIHWHGRLPEGPKIFAANHPSATDPILIHLLSPRHLSVLVTGNAFAMPLFGRYLRHVGQISVIPGQGRQALDRACERLRAGESVGIFPEGLVSPREGGYHPPRSGAARLALGVGAPVIPIGIYLPRERSYYISSGLTGKRTAAYWYLHGPYAMTVGEAVCFNGDAEDHGAVDSATSLIMERIRSLADESEDRLRRFLPAGSRAAAL